MILQKLPREKPRDGVPLTNSIPIKFLAVFLELALQELATLPSIIVDDSKFLEGKIAGF
jgi:hypothetical protein